MGTKFAGFVIDPTKCSQLSLEEKRELVYEISLWADNAPEILKSWSRRELRQLICAELGKERKFTGVTKPKMIAHLLRLISLRKMRKKKDDPSSNLAISEVNQTGKKRRKKEYSLPSLDNVEHDTPINTEKKRDVIICQNLACQAILVTGDGFCRKCSCCICHQYDEDKDPSLWVICSSDPPYNMKSCGMSFHLKCVLDHEKASVTKNSGYVKVDGCFYCFCCRKLNWLLRCWQKQLSLAICAKTVDQLLPRLSLCQEILEGSERYKALHAIVDTAAKKLKNEIGPFDKVPIKMARRAVKQLACGTEVQNLLACAATAEVDDAFIPCSTPELGGGTKPKSLGPSICQIQFENISPVSVVISLYSEEKISEDTVIGYRLWHRKSDDPEYSEKPTCIIYKPDRRATISQLIPSTEYHFLVSVLGSTKDLGMCEARYVTQAPQNSSGNPSSQSSDSNHARQSFLADLSAKNKEHACPLIFQADSQWGSSKSSDKNCTSKLPKAVRKNLSKVLPSQDTINNNEKMDPPSSDDMPFVCSNSDHLDTPTKSDIPKNLPDAVNEKESSEREYEYCVKVIRWLECEGHMERDFRVKFLTWFSLKATVQERRVVKAFIDVLVDEPESLVDQLIDAFVDGICTKEKPILQNGFSTRLWH